MADRRVPLLRQPGRRDAEFTELECRLTEEQVQMYDGAVHQWQASLSGSSAR